MVKKNILKTGIFKIELPAGWNYDNKGDIISLYKDEGNSGVIQISTYSHIKGNGDLNPKSFLQEQLKKQNNEVKVKTYRKNKKDYAISGYHLHGKWISKEMVVISGNKLAFVTYNIKFNNKNIKILKEVNKIFNSFNLEDEK